MNLYHKIIGFLGLKKSMVALLSMVILVGLGEKMAERFLPIYLLALGGGILSIGFLNGLDNLLSALYSFPGGYLSDRLGHKKALLVFNLIAMFGYVIVIIFPYWQAVFIGSVFFLSWTAISLPATMSLVSKSLPQNKRTMGVSLHSLVRRIPMALGPIIGGLMIGLYGEKNGVRMSFVIALILGGVSLILQQLMIEEEDRQCRAEKNPLTLWGEMPVLLKKLLVSDILVRFAEQIPYAFVVVWCIKNNGISALEFGLLTTIEMATAMLVYIPIAYLADKSSKKPFVVITFFNFAVFPLVLLFSRSFTMMIIAFIVRGLKEFGEPTRKALIMDLAPEDKKACMFGMYYLVRDIIVSLAAVGGAFLWQISPETNLLTATCFGFLGMAFFWIFGKDSSSQIKNTEPK
ncbi:MAG: MFS transporter [Planctomycetota bacterium]